MELKDLKSGMFGFKKNSVYEYISELNRICSANVEEVKQEKLSALADLSKKNEELNNKVVCLESENDSYKKEIFEKTKLIAELTEENEKLKNDMDKRKAVEAEVADILAEARKLLLPN